MKKFILVLVMILLVGCGKNSLDLESIESKIKDTNLFSNNMVDLDYLNSKYGLDTEGISEAKICMSSMLDNASMYAIFKADNVNEVKKNTDAFMEKYSSSWMMGYNLEQESLVENRVVTTYDNYIIYIISTDNEKVLNIIKG